MLRGVTILAEGYCCHIEHQRRHNVMSRSPLPPLSNRTTQVWGEVIGKIGSDLLQYLAKWVCSNKPCTVMYVGGYTTKAMDVRLL